MGSGATEKMDATTRLLHLLAEPGFAELEQLIAEPNIFRIVGRTHYERWHACFLGWLLDVSGSHLVGEYSLKRLLLLAHASTQHKAQRDAIAELTASELSDVTVAPNESNSTEVSVIDVGRFDVFITGRYKTLFGEERRFNVLVEVKVDAPASAIQARRYADWLHRTHHEHVNVLAYISPDSKLDASVIGDTRWSHVPFQMLHDQMLLPLLEHPRLNNYVKPFIVQYIKNLRAPHKGLKMAITEHEKRIATALYEKYSDVFDMIYEALAAEGAIDYDIADTQTPRTRASGRLAVRIGTQTFSDAGVRPLFEQVLKFLVDFGHITKIPLPWGNSPKRFVLSNAVKPEHPNGRPFFYPVRSGAYWMESHYARDRAMKVLADLCGDLDLSFEVIPTPD